MNADRNAAIERRYAEGATFGTIAAELGVSRNVVAGHLNRRRLLSRQEKGSAANIVEMTHPAPLIPSHGCLWAEGHRPDLRFCGEPVVHTGSPFTWSWCAEHRARVYQR